MLPRAPVADGRFFSILNGMTETRLDDLKYALDRCEKQIELELSLVSARMTWLVISQSFLVGAFVAAGNVQPRAFGLSVQAVVSVVGLLICVWVRTGVQAALRVVDLRKEDRRTLLEVLSAEFKIALTAVNTRDKEHEDGNRPPRMIPTMLIVAWIALVGLWVARVLFPQNW